MKLVPPKYMLIDRKQVEIDGFTITQEYNIDEGSMCMVDHSRGFAVDYSGKILCSKSKLKVGDNPCPFRVEVAPYAWISVIQTKFKGADHYQNIVTYYKYEKYGYPIQKHHVYGGTTYGADVPEGLFAMVAKMVVK